MNTKKISTVLALVGILALPATSLANTYHYISNSGTLQSVQADTPVMAISVAPNIAYNSGVQLATRGGVGGDGSGVFTNTAGNHYQFVDARGNLQSINAVNASVALSIAPNIAPTSGVILVNSSTMIR